MAATRKQHRIAAVILLGATLVAGLAVLLLSPTFTHWRVERMLAKLNRGRDEHTARALFKLMAEGAVSEDDGARILAFFTTPRIITRTAYALGKPIGIALVYDYRIGEFTNEEIPFNNMKCVLDGKSFDTRRFFDMRSAFMTVPRYWPGWLEYPPVDGLPEVLQAVEQAEGLGMHRLVFHRQCFLPLPQRMCWTWPSRRAKPWRWLPGREYANRRCYVCDNRVEVEVKIVPSEIAETVMLMEYVPAESETALPPIRIDNQFNVLFGTLTVKCLSHPTINPAADAVFKWSFVDAAGKLKPLSCATEQLSGKLHPEQTSSCGMFLDDAMLGYPETGVYRVKFILEPDPERAYLDPRIRAIWNKTLTVEAEIEVARARLSGDKQQRRGGQRR